MTQENSYLWVGAQIAEKRSSTGSAVERQYFAQGFTEGAATYFYTRDHLGSIREVLDSTGAIVARYDYSPFGEVDTLTETVSSDFRYTGHFYHAPSGLHLTLYRAYDPAQGRWLSRDPIGELGGLNLYGYVGNNVVNFWDPYGHEPTTAAAAFGGAIFAGGSGAGVTAVVTAATPVVGTGVAIAGASVGYYQLGDQVIGPLISDLIYGRPETWFSKPHGKGERGQTAKPDGTANPGKKFRPHPTDPTKIIFRDPHTGKNIIKPKPRDSFPCF